MFNEDEQEDDFLMSNTVAKVTQSIDRGVVTETVDHDGNTYKCALVACTYHCG